MSDRYILTIDIGTSSTKTALWTAAGARVASATCDYSLTRSQPAWAEIDAREWWRAACLTTRQVLAEAHVPAPQVAGVGVDGLSWTLLPVDAQVEPLAPALIWLDRRAEAEAAALRNGPHAERLVNLSANPLDPAYITPKLLWLQTNHPDIFDAAHAFLTSSGYLTARLTGELTCDFTQAYGYHFFDTAEARWDEAALALLGIPAGKLPRLCPPGEVVGTVTPRAAEATGLAAGTPVIAGCLDAAAGALGAGVVRPGQTMDQGGQAGGMGLSVDRVVVEPRLIFSHHVLPGQYLLQSGTVGGGSLAWFRDTLGQAEVAAAERLGVSAFELLSDQAGQAQPGSGGLLFLPYMAGERTPIWSTTARGVFFGLSYRTTRADILRAIMEGCAFAVYHNLVIAEERGARVREWLGEGGATRSAVWCQIKADVTGRPFIVARCADGGEGGHGLGLFALTAHAVGLCDDAAACVERLLPQRTVYEPSPARHALYQERFAIYLDVVERLLPVFDRCAERVTSNE